MKEKFFKKLLIKLMKENFLVKMLVTLGGILTFIIHYGAGAYICGEETALLESIEGNKK